MDRFTDAVHIIVQIVFFVAFDVAGPILQACWFLLDSRFFVLAYVQE